jgi:hypothetical protein
MISSLSVVREWATHVSHTSSVIFTIVRDISAPTSLDFLCFIYSYLSIYLSISASPTFAGAEEAGKRGEAVSRLGFASEIS